jgi:hypothetical protein
MTTAIERDVETSAGGSQTEVYRLPTDEAYLFELMTYVFEEYWQGIIFGPVIEGAAFEIKCPCAPTKISLFDGYVTVHFGGTHFHLCIGENEGSKTNPTPPELRLQRRTSRAEIFRKLDRDKCPISWGLSLYNGADQQQCTVFFPNPFLTEEDGIAEQPDWSRLAMWEDMSRRYLGRGPDGRDRTGKGFRRD